MPKTAQKEGTVMAWYPHAKRREITAAKGRKKMAVYNRVNYHVAVSEAASLFGYFNQPGIPDSHFYVLKDGSVEQYVDTIYQAFADLDGNDATVSIETQGGLKNGEKEKWTRKQRQTIADITKWVSKEHGVKLVQARDSKLGSSSQGISWHRLGINGNFPKTGILRGRQQLGGGMNYSTSFGKTCPGDAKIKQIPSIVKATGGKTKPAPSTSKKTEKNADPSQQVKKGKKKLSKKLKTDGLWGRATTQTAQRHFGTPDDGEVWNQNVQWKASNPGLTLGWKWVATRNAKSSPVIAAIQRWLGVDDDGILGPITIKAFQRRMGTHEDGELWAESPAIKEFQKRLNRGKL